MNILYLIKLMNVIFIILALIITFLIGLYFGGKGKEELIHNIQHKQNRLEAAEAMIKELNKLYHERKKISSS